MEIYEKMLQTYKEYLKADIYKEKIAGNINEFRYPQFEHLKHNFVFNDKKQIFELTGNNENIENTIDSISINEITLYELLVKEAKKLHLYDFLGYKATYEEKVSAYKAVFSEYIKNHSNGKWNYERQITRIKVSDLQIRQEFKVIQDFIKKSKTSFINLCRFKGVQNTFQFGSTLKGTDIVYTDDNLANTGQEMLHAIYHIEEGIPGFNNDNMNIVEKWANVPELYLMQLLEGRMQRRIRENTSPHDIKFLDYVFLRAYGGQAFLKEDAKVNYHSIYSLIEPSIKLLISGLNEQNRGMINELLINGICLDKTDIIKQRFNQTYGENAYEKIFYDYNLFNRLNTVKDISGDKFKETFDIMFSKEKLVNTVLDTNIIRLIWLSENINKDKNLVIDLIEDYSNIKIKNNEKITINDWFTHVKDSFGEEKYNLLLQEKEKYREYLEEKNVKLFLCYPTVSEEYDKIRDSGVAPHLSLLCLATHVQHSHPDVESVLVDGHHESFKEICLKIQEENPDIIGFSVDFTNYNTAVKLAQYAKSINPNVKIGCGSNHASNMYEPMLKNQEAFDFVGINDGEEALEQYINYLKGNIEIEKVPNIAYRQDGIIKKNQINVFDLKKMKPINYEQAGLNAYFENQERVFGNGFKMLQFTTQRGCANRPLCVFCGRYEDEMRFREPAKCAEEIAEYVDKYNLTEVWDRSDSFIQNIRWLREFTKELNKRTDRFTNGETTFKTYSRADQLLRPEVIEILKSLNFRMVFIGYEAGDDRILKNIGKHATTDTYKRATKNVLDNGIDIDASFIVGLPGENLESMQNHIKFVKELSEMGLNKIRVNRLLVLPGTPLYNKVVETFPEKYKGKDIVPMSDLQRDIFKTDLYDLSDFGNDEYKFMNALDKTAQEMTRIIIEKGGAIEGYGHGKGKNLLEGDELSR